MGCITFILTAFLSLEIIHCQFINVPPLPPPQGNIVPPQRGIVPLQRGIVPPPGNLIPPQRNVIPPVAPVNRLQIPNVRIPRFSFNRNGVVPPNRQLVGNPINRNRVFLPNAPLGAPPPLAAPLLFGTSALNMVPAPRVTGFPTRRTPWVPSPTNTIAGHISLVPTASPDASTITFTSVSGAFPRVNIPANEKDDHYTKLKELFDSLYPNLPPLRRASNQTTLTLQSTADGSSIIIAVIQDDPSTVYVPYKLPGMNATAYLPFERDARQLKYPARPIYLPYPPFAVRDPNTGKTYPMYLPFQLNQFRKQGEEPYVLIPYLAPGSSLPTFSSYIPGQEPVPTAVTVTIGPTPPTEIITNPSPPEPLIPMDQPEWNALKVKWGSNLTDPNYFGDLPRTESEALLQGFTLLSDCKSSSKFVGKRYWKGYDSAIILIYDINGFIAGIQTGIPAGLLNGYPTAHLTPRPFVLDGNVFFITVYFDNPANICQSGRTTEQFDVQGTGIDLYFQNGNDPIKDTVVVPREEAEIRKTLWTSTTCYPAMGQHFYYNLRKDMPCEEFAPLFLLYNKGRLKGFGWTFLSNIQSPRFEYPTPEEYSSFLGDMVPDCLYSLGQITTLHIFLTSSPQITMC